MVVFFPKTQTTFRGKQAFTVLRSLIRKPMFTLTELKKPLTHQTGVKLTHSGYCNIPTVGKTLFYVDKDGRKIPSLNTEVLAYGWNSADIQGVELSVLNRKLTYPELMEATDCAAKWDAGDSWHDYSTEICVAAIINAVGHYRCSECGKKITVDEQITDTNDLPELSWDDFTIDGLICLNCD